MTHSTSESSARHGADEQPPLPKEKLSAFRKEPNKSGRSRREGRGHVTFRQTPLITSITASLEVPEGSRPTGTRSSGADAPADPGSKSHTVQDNNNQDVGLETLSVPGEFHPAAPDPQVTPVEASHTVFYSTCSNKLQS